MESKLAVHCRRPLPAFPERSSPLRSADVPLGASPLLPLELPPPRQTCKGQSWDARLYVGGRTPGCRSPCYRTLRRYTGPHWGCKCQALLLLAVPECAPQQALALGSLAIAVRLAAISQDPSWQAEKGRASRDTVLPGKLGLAW